MIGILIITHGTLGEALIQCACHVLNRRPAQLAQLGVSAADDPLDLFPTAKTLLDSVDSGDGVLVLTDLYGATPANIAGKLAKPGQVECIAGINMPMLLRVLNYRDKNTIQTVVTKAISGGCDGVMQMKVDRDAKS